MLIGLIRCQNKQKKEKKKRVENYQIIARKRGWKWRQKRARNFDMDEHKNDLDSFIRVRIS